MHPQMRAGGVHQRRSPATWLRCFDNEDQRKCRFRAIRKHRTRPVQSHCALQHKSCAAQSVGAGFDRAEMVHVTIALAHFVREQFREIGPRNVGLAARAFF